MVLLYTDPLFQLHDTGPHPENARRLQVVHQRLENNGLVVSCLRGEIRPATPEQVAWAHDQAVIDRAREVCEAGGGVLDADTVVSPESYRVALAAAGACGSAVADVLNGKANKALCLVRPPGHHAERHRSMGFCLFNNLAIAALIARNEFGVERILAVDWDVHHGNGTQHIFWNDPGVLFMSIHRFGGGFYPGTGSKDETGTGAGLGYTVNLPIRYGTSRQNYLGEFRNALEKAADHLRPELVLVSAGFDADARDPIGSLGLDTDDFVAMTRNVLDVAKTHAKGRIVSCLEGGYNLTALADGVQAHLEELIHS